MREFKFKALIKKNRYVVDVATIDFDEKEITYYDKCLNDGDVEYKTAGFDDVELLQYTGLKDKNGKEIYEGDIIKEDLHDDEAYIFIVEWNTISASFVLREIGVPDYYGRFNDECDSFDFIIIGNIYEHKHLLDNKKNLVSIWVTIP